MEKSRMCLPRNDTNGSANSKFLFICVRGKSEAQIQTDTDDFLPPLRRLSPPPPANSHAETACSDTLTEACYARYGDENQPTVLSWILLSDLPYLLDGTDMSRVHISYATFSRTRRFTSSFFNDRRMIFFGESVAGNCNHLYP